MRTLEVGALTLVVPPSETLNSKLGRAVASVNNHLFIPAGAASRPPNIRRGVTTVWSQPYEAPAAAAETRVADLADAAAAALVEACPAARDVIRAVLHAQCTVDQQIVGSACLRLQQRHYPRAVDDVIAVGQLGTAAVPTVLKLAALSGKPTALSAADKWMAPFFRRLAGTTFGDAAAAAIVAPRLPARLAAIEQVAVVNDRPLAAPWTARAEDARPYLVSLAVKALAAAGAVSAKGALLAGDGHGAEVARLLAGDTGLPTLLAQDDPAHAVHLGSAALLATLARGVERATRTGDPVTVAAWTASISGHAGAVIARCQPDAVAIAGGWMAAEFTMEGVG